MKVFRDSGNKQCLQVGQTLQQSETLLTDMGIKPKGSFCADRTDRFYMQVCGSGTPHIHVFEIDESDLAQAKEAGFSPLNEITYQKAECRR